MKRSKKLMCLLLVLAMLLVTLFTGCGTKPEEKQEEVKKEVVVGLQWDPETLAPFAAMTDGRFATLRSVFEFLFDYKEIGGELLPCIGQKYELVAPKTYDITIYDNVYDSNGEHITADDVVFSIQTCKDLGFLGQSHNNIESVSKKSDYVVTLVVNTEDAGAFENIVTNNCIVSKKTYEASADQMASKPIGTGAYLCEEFVPGSSVTYVKRDNYWQTADKTARLSQANVDKITFQIVPEQASLMMALEGGDVDAAYFVPVDKAEGLKKSGITIDKMPRDMAEVFIFNCDPSSPCADQNLRQAICYAIDNQVMLDQIYQGQGGICYTFGTPIFGDYDMDWEKQDYYPYSEQAAKDALAASKYNGETLKIMTDTNAEHVKEAQIILSMLDKIGVKSEIMQYDAATFNGNRFDASTFDFYLTSKSSFDYVTSVWKFSFDQNLYGGHTVNFFVDEKLNELMTTCLKSETHTKANIDAAHQYLKELALGYGMCYGVNLYGSNSKIKTLAIDCKSRIVPGACEYNF